MTRRDRLKNLWGSNALNAAADIFTSSKHVKNLSESCGFASVVTVAGEWSRGKRRAGEAVTIVLYG